MIRKKIADFLIKLLEKLKGNKSKINQGNQVVQQKESELDMSVVDDGIATISAHERLGEDEKAFVIEIYALIKRDEPTTDYESLARKAPSENIEFWYECANALATFIENQIIDVHSTGRFQVANTILDKIIEHSNKVPNFWAQKIIVLNYLIKGYNYADKPAEMKAYAKWLCDATETAVQYFPDAQWFSDERARALNVAELVDAQLVADQ